MRRRLVLLGGGYAHVHLLKSLTLQAPQPIDGVDITLICPSPSAVYAGMLPGWVAGHYQLDQCVIALPPLAGHADVRFLQTAVSRIDFSRNVVHCDDGLEVPFELLSIDTGSTVDLSAVTGLAEYAMPVRPIEAFIASFARLAIQVEKNCANGKRTRVAFVGADAGGVELAMATQYRFRQYNLGVTLIAAANTFPGSVGRRLARIMRERGIAVLAGQHAMRVTPNGVELASGALVVADTVIAATGSTAAAWPRAFGLTTDRDGFILVNDRLQSVSHGNVFSAGDCATMEGNPQPWSGDNAHRGGPPLNENLRRVLRGEAPKRHVPRTRTLYLAGAGDKYAIASWGGLTVEGGWVWRWKDAKDRGFIGNS